MSMFAEIFHGTERRSSKRSKKHENTAALFNASKFVENKVCEVTAPPADPPPIDTSPPPTPQFTDDVDARTVFVGNLSLAVKQLPKKLKKHFGKCGEIESVRLRSVASLPGDHAPKRVIVHNKRFNEVSPCNAYIVFKEKESAEAACALNLTQFNGHTIRVNFAEQRRFKQRRKNLPSGVGDFSPKDSIVVKNMRKEMTDESLLALFNNGTLVPLCKDMVRNWRIVRDHHSGESKGYAFVAFKSRAVAKAALAIDGQVINERAISVQPLLEKTTARRVVFKDTRRRQLSHRKGYTWGTRTKGRFKLRQ